MMLKYILIIFSILLPAIHLMGQENQMFIEQIANKNITRESFKSNGKLIGKQQFFAQRLKQAGNDYFLTIDTKIYDEELRLKSTYTTQYRCKPGEANVLLSVFTVNPKKQKITVSVNSGDFKKLYNLNPDEMMSNLSLTMYVETGILNFLGSKNKVEIINRKLTKENNYWKVTETINIKAYLMGIRIKTISYYVTEYLTVSGQLEKQIFKGDGGDYFTITYKENS